MDVPNGIFVMDIVIENHSKVVLAHNIDISILN